MARKACCQYLGLTPLDFLTYREQTFRGREVGALMAGGKDCLDNGDICQALHRHHQEDNTMEVLRWILGCILCCAFLWVAALNWCVFWQRHVRGAEAPSWIPLLAGLFGVAATFLLPVSLTNFWWVPLIVDWGSAPGIIYTICWHVSHKS